MDSPFFPSTLSINSFTISLTPFFASVNHFDQLRSLSTHTQYKQTYFNTAIMRSATLLALLPLAIAAPFQNAKRDRPAPVVVPRGGNAIDGKYIVRMKADAISASVESAISSIKADADYTYSTGFNGFAASIEAEELEKLRDDPNVSSPSHLLPSLVVLFGFADMK